MTRIVLTGPPVRRGLAWGAAVLVGAAVLLGVRDGSGVAGDEAAKGALPADLALIPGEAFGFITVRVADLWNDPGTKRLRTELAQAEPDTYKELEKSVSVPPAEIERLTVVMTKTPAPNDQGPVVVLLVATAKPYDRKKVLGELVPEAREQTRKSKTYYVLGDAAVYPVNATTFLMGGTTTVEEVMDQAGKGSGLLGPAVAAAAGKHHVAGGMRPAALLGTIGNMIPPQAEAFKPLLEAQLAYGTIDFGKEAKLQGRLVCGGESEARDTVTAVKSLVALAQVGLPLAEAELNKQPKGRIDNFKKLFKDFEAGLKALPVEATGKEVTVGLTLKDDLPTISHGVLEGIMLARGAASRLTSVNNLKQMALAMHNYADSNGEAFPAAAIYDKDGKPLLSWRVAILPYVEQDALYKEFRLDEPWDSEHNKKLLAKMPPIYAMPQPGGPDENARPTTTHYRVFHGKDAAFEGTSGLRIADFTGGTSNTILIVEAADAVPWTKPDELPFDPKKDPPKLGLKDAKQFNAAFADGSVRALEKDIDKETLKAQIMRTGGK
jgi:hypothetical protein